MEKIKLLKFHEEGFIHVEGNNDFKSFIKSIKTPINELLPNYKSSNFPNVEHSVSGAALSQRLNNSLKCQWN